METIITRTNQRNHVTYLLPATNGIPECPHCGAPMEQSSLKNFQNSNCICWWAGARDGIYPLQVVVSLTDEAEKKYQAERQQKASAAQDKILARDRQIYQLGEHLVQNGWTPRGSLKKQMAGHWSKDGSVVVAKKNLNYGGWFASYILAGAGGKKPMETLDINELMAALQA